MDNNREKITERLLVPLTPSGLKRLQEHAAENHLKDGTMGRVLILDALDRMEAEALENVPAEKSA